MSEVTASKGSCFDFIAFFGYIHTVIVEHSFLKHIIFTKLSQIVCGKVVESFLIQLRCFVIFFCLKHYSSLYKLGVIIYGYVSLNFCHVLGLDLLL